MNKVLVTGAAGYIGSTLTNLLLSSGYEVVGVDRLKFGINPLLGVLYHPNFTLVPCDIAETERYEQYVDENTAVVNLAAVVGEPACKKYEDEARRTNYGGAKAVVDLAIRKHAKKLVFVTTCSNYGMVPQGELATETSELHPLGLYAQSKVDTEKYLFDTVGSKLNWTILRFATVFGLSPRLRFDLTVNEFAARGCLDKKLSVFLPHTVRPYVHVYDVARAIRLVLEEPGKSCNEIFNVGDTEQNYEKQQIVDAVKQLVPDLEVEYVEKGNDLRDYRVSFRKIHDVLGYRITKTMQDGAREIVEAVQNGYINDIENRNYYNHL